MLKINLSTRPFYNDRLVVAALALVTALVVALTAYNAQQVSTLSSRRSALSGQIGRDQATADRANKAAETIEQSLKRNALQGLASSASEANVLIAERTFSWTIFFNLIEQTLPLDVHLLMVAPRFDTGDLLVTMTAVAKRPGDTFAFVQALTGTHAFFDVQVINEERSDDGTFLDTLRAKYLQPVVAAPAKSPAAGAGRGGRP